MGLSPQFISTPRNEQGTFVNADGTGLKTIWTAGASGSRIDGLIAYSDDGTARNPVLSIKKGAATAVPFAITTVPVGPVAANILAQCPGIGAYGLILENGDVLQANMAVAVTAGSTVWLTVIGGDF